MLCKDQCRFLAAEVLACSVHRNTLCSGRGFRSQSPSCSRHESSCRSVCLFISVMRGHESMTLSPVRKVRCCVALLCLPDSVARGHAVGRAILRAYFLPCLSVQEAFRATEENFEAHVAWFSHAVSAPDASS